VSVFAVAEGIDATTVLGDVSEFVAQLLGAMAEKYPALADAALEMEVDHVCYRCDSKAEYLEVNEKLARCVATLRFVTSAWVVLIAVGWTLSHSVWRCPLIRALAPPLLGGEGSPQKLVIDLSITP
jgi:hypothetical protein